MPVWSEPNRYYSITAPGGFQIAQSINAANILVQYRTAQLAAKALCVLAADALNAIRTYYLAGAAVGANQLNGAGLDGPELADLLLYLSYLALETVRAQAVIRVGVGNHQPAYVAFAANIQDIIFRAAFAIAHLQNLPGLAIFANQNYNNRLAGLDATTGANAAAPQKTGLGTVELLCRIIANNCPNMVTFHTRVRNLRLAQLPAPGAHAVNGWWDCHNKGIPKTVFVCTGSNGAVPLQPPTIIVTTSQDCWGKFSSIEYWVSGCRQSLRRLNWNGVGAQRDPIRMSPQSLIVRTQYQNAIAALQAPTMTAQRRNARQGVINAYNGFVNGIDTNHRHELAMPLTCPRFRPTPRCLRCQAFFRYNIQALLTLTGEFNLRGATSLKCHQRRYCAECIAHYACRHALNNAGIVVAGNPSH